MGIKYNPNNMFVYRVTEDNKHNIKITIQEINDWFCSNSLTINYNKTNYLQFSTKKKQKEIQFQIITTNTVLTNMNSMKFHGLTIDSTMLWNLQRQTSDS